MSVVTFIVHLKMVCVRQSRLFILDEIAAKLIHYCTGVVPKVSDLTCRWWLFKKFLWSKFLWYIAKVRSLDTLRYLVFVWQLPIVNALSEFVNTEKTTHRYVTQYFHLKGQNESNIKPELDSIPGKSGLSFITLKY